MVIIVRGIIACVQSAHVLNARVRQAGLALILPPTKGHPTPYQTLTPYQRLKLRRVVEEPKREVSVAGQPLRQPVVMAVAVEVVQRKPFADTPLQHRDTTAGIERMACKLLPNQCIRPRLKLL